MNIMIKNGIRKNLLQYFFDLKEKGEIGGGRYGHLAEEYGVSLQELGGYADYLHQKGCLKCDILPDGEGWCTITYLGEEYIEDPQRRHQKDAHGMCFKGNLYYHV